MLTLYQGPPAWGSPNLSPFCMKLEAYLRMADIPYQGRPPDLRKAPKGKVPYVALDGRLLGDSTHIIDVLKKRFGDPLDARLGAREHATGRLIQRTLEEGTYWVEIYNRWATDNFPLVRDALFGGLGLPRPLVLVFGPLAQARTRRALFNQGTSRHSRDDIFEAGRRDFAAVAELLGDGPYLFGETPTSYDAVLYAFTRATFHTPFAQPYGACPPALAAHQERVHTRYFADV
jgi:glutathione S-transferase